MAPQGSKPRVDQEVLGLGEVETEQPKRTDVLDLGRPTALVHILTPEFHSFDLETFDNIPDEVVERASAQDLQPSLFWQYIPKSRRQSQEVSAFSYLSADEGFISVAMTPEEYDTASESLGKLAQRVLNKVLTQRDTELRKSTGDKTARARTDEDIRIANRGAMRAVMDRQAAMENLLEDAILPKIQLIERFTEMTEGRNPNLSRGTKGTVSARFEELRTTVFDDMLDAVALQRGWSADMADRAKLIIQKRLYISGNIGDRVTNFREMLTLSNEYYGHKRALILTKIEESRKYQRANQEVVIDIMTVDEQRQNEKTSKQLQFENDE